MRRYWAARNKVAHRLLQGPAVTTNEQGQPIAASFHNYIERRRGRTFVGFPTKWRVDSPQLENPAPIGVVMHVYFTDLVPEILEQLRNIEMPFDLLITNASGEELDLEGFDHPACKSIRVFPVKNHGRDIFPLIQLVNGGYLNPYDTILKIHTKKSAWRAEHELAGSGDEWKEGFYRDLLDSPENVREIVQAMRENPHVGIVTSNGSICGPEQWGGDQPIVDDLLRRIGMPLHAEDLEFASGSIYWIRGFILQGLRSFELEEQDFESEAGQVDATTAHAIERIIGIVATEAGFRITEREGLKADESPSADELAKALEAPQTLARAVPYYLPQFHSFEENDAWWGKGFTEWTNVTKARPVFYGHNQPLLPADLGFYDLRLDEVRAAQKALADRVGINGFMYYYYWFSGRKLMQMPIEKLHASNLDQPFSIMWANENWTRRWDGDTKGALIEQEYEKVPPEQFIDDVMDLLKDERYMRVDGAALLAVYKISAIPNYTAVLEHWRERAREAGVGELHIVAVDVGKWFEHNRESDDDDGVDGFIAFPPHNHFYFPADQTRLGVEQPFYGNLLSYRHMAHEAEQRYLAGYPERDYPGAMVNFDNTARRQLEPDAWVGSNPYTFRRWLRAAVMAVQDREPDRRIVIINAWNEWAEAAVLEPTQRFGHSYLCAVRSALH